MYHINPSWFLIGGASAEFYPEEITNSPLVDDDMAWGIFLVLQNISNVKHQQHNQGQGSLVYLLHMK